MFMANLVQRALKHADILKLIKKNVRLAIVILQPVLKKKNKTLSYQTDIFSVKL